MKEKILFALVIILTVISIVFVSIFLIDHNTKKAEIAELKKQLESQSTERVNVLNDYWQYTAGGKTLYGNIFFDDLSLLKSIEVTYKDIMFNTLEFESTSITKNDDENKIVTSCIYEDELPYFVVLTVNYKNGYSEDITIKIALG